MSDFAAKLPPATPENQSAPQAHAGGTNALRDYSRSAQRSLAREPDGLEGNDEPQVDEADRP
jgi:hypothetical protein